MDLNISEESKMKLLKSDLFRLLLSFDNRLVIYEEKSLVSKDNIERTLSQLIKPSLMKYVLENKALILKLDLNTLNKSLHILDIDECNHFIKGFTKSNKPPIPIINLIGGLLYNNKYLNTRGFIHIIIRDLDEVYEGKIFLDKNNWSYYHRLLKV